MPEGRRSSGAAGQLGAEFFNQWGKSVQDLAVTLDLWWLLAVALNYVICWGTERGGRVGGAL